MCLGIRDTREEEEEGMNVARNVTGISYGDGRKGKRAEERRGKGRN